MERRLGEVKCEAALGRRGSVGRRRVEAVEVGAVLEGGALRRWACLGELERLGPEAEALRDYRFAQLDEIVAFAHQSSFRGV
ncbi:MAG TPA: hypothetical protein VGK67_40865 [Myxococcales bacterium]